MEKWRKEWLSTEEGKAYGELFFKRATGELPEMESSKAAAKRAAGLLTGQARRVVDVGCGAGHYYRSLRAAIGGDFQYLGVDATPLYVKLACEAFNSDRNASFMEGDIFSLPLEDRTADLVMCNNVLLHLPSIAKPLRELVRVAVRTVLIRTLVSDKSYVVKDVAPDPGGDEFDEEGEPKNFHFLSIYSERYVERVIRSTGRVRAIGFERDVDFDSRKVADTGDLLEHAWDKTAVMGGMQVSGMLLLPWTWITVELEV